MGNGQRAKDEFGLRIEAQTSLGQRARGQRAKDDFGQRILGNLGSRSPIGVHGVYQAQASDAAAASRAVGCAHLRDQPDG